jgi:cell division protein FtsW
MHNKPAHYDYLLIITTMALLVIGLLMLTSASINFAERVLHQPFYYFFHQLGYLIIALGVGAIVVNIPVRYWEVSSCLLLGFTMLLLLLVLVPGVGHAVNGSMRWLGFGSLRLQVSEVAKLAMICYIASYLWRNNLAMQSKFSCFLQPLLILALVAILLLREPDFGDLVVIVLTSLGMMFLAGIRLRYFCVLLAAVAAVLVMLAISAPYRLLRLTAFLHPWSHPFDSGYQLTQSLIAFGRGGWFGLGLGKSIQKLFYLPESHTDFLFAVIAEELGLLGTITIVLLFTLLFFRVFYIGRKAQQYNQHFAGFVAYGCALCLLTQAVVNIGVNIGLLPTKGLTLPFMSYGGSSLLINCLMVALVLRIDYELRHDWQQDRVS